MKALIGAILAVASFAAAAHPLQDKAASSASFFVRGVRVFDGERVWPEADVLVRDGRIAAVGAALPAAPGIPVVDGKGRTLLPGLIDAHNHVFSTDALKQGLAFGVTVLVDMFMSPDLLKEVKAAQGGAAPPMQAFLVSPGVLCTVPGGHGSQFGMSIPTIEAGTDLQAFVDARIAEGADFIKLIQDDFSAYKMKRPTLSNEQVAGLVQAAHKRGKMAIIHAATLKNCEDSLRAGVDGLAHLFFENAADPDFGALAARSGAFVIPTLSVVRAMNGKGCAPGFLDDPDLKPFLKPDDAAGLKSRSTAETAPGAYEAAETALRQLRDAKVRLLAGTDAPNPGTAYGVSLHGELELLVAAGMTPLEALRAATSVPADVFGLKDRGRIRAGAIADLVLVEGDPTAAIKATRRIVGVWKGGRAFDREAYRKAVGEAAQTARNLPVPEYGSSGLIADFAEGKIAAAFGAGWIISTDAFAGGHSTAAMEWSPEGAEGSRGSLKMTGEVKAGAAPWAGVAFSPGSTMMAPANLSGRKGVAFWAKGQAGPCAVEFFARGRGFRPVAKMFTAGPEWKEFQVTFEELGLDGSDIMMIFFGAVNEPGPFTLWIDRVRLI